MTATATAPACPKCGGNIWDNRGKKTNAKQPDFKCQNRSCDWAQWPPKSAGPVRQQAAPGYTQHTPQPPEFGEFPGIPMASAEPAPAQPSVPTAAERFKRLCTIQDAAFTHALILADKASKAGYVVTLEGISALTAQILIPFTESRR